MRIRPVSLWVALLIMAMGSEGAWAETVELVTYFPPPAATGGTPADPQFRTLRVGNNYLINANDPFPLSPDGTMLVWDSLGIRSILTGGEGYPNRQNGEPAGVLEVRGAPDVFDRVVFIPGDDTAAPGTPSLSVGIGTAAPDPALSLHVVPSLVLSNPNIGNNALTVFQVGQNLTFNTQNGMLVYGNEGLPANFQGYHNPNQFDVVASAGAVNGLTVAADANAPIRFVTNGEVGDFERMRIAGNGNVGIGTNNPQALLQVGAASLFVQADQGGSLEIGGNNAIANPTAGGTPYLDLHFGQALIGPALDFNARLINEGDGRLDVHTREPAGLQMQRRLSIGPNVGVATTAPQTTSPQNGMNAGNLEANDLFLRSQGRWISQMGNRFLEAVTVVNFADGPFVNFGAAETVIGQITVTATGRPLLIVVSYIVCNANNGPPNAGRRSFISRIRRDGSGANGPIVIQQQGGVSGSICEGDTLVVAHTPAAGQHTFFFNLFNATNANILRGQVTQISVTEVRS